MQRRQIAVATVAIALVILLWPHLSILAATGYSYLWWLRPEVHWAAPELLAAGNSTAVVPKVIHQTWQTTKVPKKWQAARRSCLDLHPDYEHRLWTDADGLKFIQVCYSFWFFFRQLCCILVCGKVVCVL
jgi:hypothetical protein